MPKDYSATNAPKEEGYQLDVTVEELNGNGYQTLAAKDSEPTVKVVDAIFHQGRVKVMFQRALTTDGDMDVQIPPESFIPVAFMQWSGFDKEIRRAYGSFYLVLHHFRARSGYRPYADNVLHHGWNFCWSTGMARVDDQSNPEDVR